MCFKSEPAIFLLTVVTIIDYHNSETIPTWSNQISVVIVGSSVSGLTLANMLERLNIDYIVLESYNTIAPQVGASTSLQANGLRILDQLSCADTLLDLVDAPLQNQVV